MISQAGPCFVSIGQTCPGCVKTGPGFSLVIMCNLRSF